MASTSKDQQAGKKEKTLPIINDGGDCVEEEEAAVPFSVTQALQNDLVLDNIFSYLSVPDLKACRQVCQQWKQASRRTLVEKCNPVGFFGRSVFSRQGFKKIHRIEDMSRLSSVISTSNSSEFPVTKFMVDANIIKDRLGSFYLPEDHDGLQKKLKDFFQAIVTLATQLEFGFMNGAKLFQLNAPLNVEFPRLKTLKAKSERGGSPSFQSNLTFFQNILENSPQLSTLDMDVDGSETMNLLINLMERVVPKRKISTLHLHSRTSLLDNHFHRLANIDLKLTSLRLHLDYKSSSNGLTEGWMKFLESQSETLENLFVELCSGLRSQEWTVEFPYLRKLKRLAIESDNIGFSGIFYTKQFPSLKQLSLNSNCDNVLKAFLNSNHPPLETVEILELPFLNDPVWIWHAARIFPNVKKLKIPSRMEIVQAVFQAWKNVEELTIREMGWGGSYADELLAVNFQGVLHSNRNRVPNSKMPAKFLQDLKTLKLEGFSNKAPTTWICHFVLLKMGSLKCLDLSKCRNPESKIDESMLSKMRKKFLVLC